MATNRSQGVQRVLAKLEVSVQNGNYYEAHQMYRTLYFRYLSQKKYADLLNLLWDGALLLLKHEQHNSGADLAILYVDVLSKSKAVPTQEIFNKLASMFSLITPGIPERETFLSAALHWSSENDPQYKVGHPELHQYIAHIFWKEKNYSYARYHFIRSCDGIGCAAMLIEFHKQKGFPSEVDLFVAQAVLQYLTHSNRSTAIVVFDNYTSHHPGIQKGPPYFLPLLNFIWFLLQAIEGGKLTVFTILCEQYQPSIQRDPSYVDYLDKIGQLFFGVAPPKPQQEGFAGLFQSFLSGMDDSNSEDEPRPSTSDREIVPEELD